jgi:hypothetical protein
MILSLLAWSLSADPAAFPAFDVKEIAKDLKIGYAVHLVDIDGDKKLDIVVVDKERVVWYQNPTWKMRTITAGKTKPDNVCLTSAHIDNDGEIDLVLGAGWRPADTNTPGTLHWLKRGKSLDDEWTLHEIPCEEPTVHRIKRVTMDGKPTIVLAPLQGQGSSAKGNWQDGRPVRIVAYPIPADPTKKENWKPKVLFESLHVVHNFCVAGHDGELAFASYRGVSLWDNELRKDEIKKKTLIHLPKSGNHDAPNGSRGSSEIAMTDWSKKRPLIATIEPWHGNQVVLYRGRSGERIVLDDHLRWGHAIAFADLDGDGIDELIAGVRDNPDPKKDTFNEKRGVRIYKNINGAGSKWERMMLDENGVAVEDMAVGDLNGDGRPDIVAVGRATGNCRIYFNLKN